MFLQFRYCVSSTTEASRSFKMRSVGTFGLEKKKENEVCKKEKEKNCGKVGTRVQKICSIMFSLTCFWIVFNDMASWILKSYLSV